MNYASPEKSSQLTATAHRLERSLLTKLTALKERLDNFIVVDTHGNQVGDMRNLVLNQRQLYLVVVQPDVRRHWRFVLLNSHAVQHINLHDRVIFVHTTQTDVSYLPEHQATPLAISSSDASAHQFAPVSQLPAPLLTDRTHRLEPAGTASSGWLAAQSAPQLYGSSTEPQLLDAPATPKMLASVVDTSNPQASDARSSNLDESNVAQAV